MMLQNDTKKTNTTRRVKVSGSGLRVLELLKLLTLGTVNLTEFLQFVEDKGDAIYRKEVVLKYLNTIKLLGFKISKSKCRYFLTNSVETMDYTKNELSLLRFIENYADETKQVELQSYINDALQKIERTYSEKTKRLIDRRTFRAYRLKHYITPKDKKIQILEKYCKDKLKLKIKYKSSQCSIPELFKVSPVKILYKRKQTILIAYDYVNSEYKEFLLDYITDIEQTPQKAATNYAKSVIFKLKGRLAKSYMLKEGEKVLEFGDDYKIVSNHAEDKIVLMHRLLRYYDKCEVIYPIEAKEQILSLIEEIEKIYD